MPPARGQGKSYGNDITDWVLKEIAALGEAFGEALTAERQAIYAEALADIPVDRLRRAIRTAVRELKWFPKIAEIRELAGTSSEVSSDGRPGVEEAWAVCPKSEEMSAVWTDEMAAAFEVARKLLNEENEIAARMAFKEKYASLLLTARAESTPVRWRVSLGWDKPDRVRALSDAVRKKQVSPAQAYGLLGPEAGDEFLQSLPVPERKLLVGETKPDLSQLTGLPRVLAELAMAKELPDEVTATQHRPYKTPADRSPEEVRQLREKANAQRELLTRSRSGSVKR